jgi:hypothetical protein
MSEKKKRSDIKIAPIKASCRGSRELADRHLPLAGEFSLTLSTTG